MKDLAARKLGIRQSRPEVREEMRAALMQEEIQKAAQRSQNRLAKEQLDLSRRAQRETERASRRQWQLDKRALDLQARQIAAEIRQAGGSDKEASRAATKWKAAGQWMDGKLKDLKPRQVDPRMIYNNLTTRFKLSKKKALKMMLNGPKPLRVWAHSHQRGAWGGTWQNP
jgi:hypothetical protein